MLVTFCTIPHFSVAFCNYFWILATLQYRLFYYNNIFFVVILTCLSNCSFWWFCFTLTLTFYSFLQYLPYCYLLMFFSLRAVLIFFVFETHFFAFICHICNFVTTFFLRFFSSFKFFWLLPIWFDVPSDFVLISSWSNLLFRYSIEMFCV